MTPIDLLSIGMMKRDKNVKKLIRAMDKKNDTPIRCAAAEALGELGNDRALKPLVEALKDSKSDLQVNAAEALGLIGSARAVEPLITALQHGNYRLTSKAAAALGLIGDARAVEPLITILMENSALKSISHRAAVVALSQIGDPRAVEPLIDLLNDKNERMCLTAAEALVAIYQSGTLGAQDKKAILARENDIRDLGRDTHRDSPPECYTHDDYGNKGFHVDFSL